MLSLQYRVACHNTSEIGGMGGGDSTLPYYLPY